MGGCTHQRREIEGQTHEKNKHGQLVTIRSYRCLDCDAVFTDKTIRGNVPTLKTSGAETGRAKEAEKPQNNFPAPAKKEKQTMAKKDEEKKGPAKRTENALADGRWKVGETYTQKVTPRKGKNKGKEMTCKMTVLKSGFKDQDGEVWPTPTALTTNFAVKVLGQNPNTRRPASTFFGIDIPKTKKVQTRAPAKEKPAAKKAAKAPAKKPAAKATPAKAPAKPAETKSELAPPPKLDI